MIKNYGFVEPEEIKSDEYILGGIGLPKTILQPLGNWALYLPVYEPQFENFETYGCTVWGTQNAIETLMKRTYQDEPNYSERFTYIGANVTPPGADPHKVAEVIRTQGLIDHELLKNETSTLAEFNTPKPLTKDLIDKGEEWLNNFDFGHEWLWTSYPGKTRTLEILREYLQYSPVCVSVTAWNTDPNTGLYVDNGMPNTHWTMCFGIADESLLIFDSYDQSKKRLDPNHRIQMCKRYSISPSTRQEKLTLIESILKWIQEIINKMYKPISEVTLPTPPINTQPEPPQALKWGNPVDVRHSIRVICDEMGLSVPSKNLICAVIQAESGFDCHAINKNYRNDKVVSTDYGLCQINDYYWIGNGKYFTSVNEVYDNPEKSVRFMIKRFKEGHLNWWIAYKNGSYKKYL